MFFNPDPAGQAVEVTFSKKIPADHPPIFSNDIAAMKVDEHKHLGVAHDSRPIISRHIQSAIRAGAIRAMHGGRMSLMEE